MKKFLIAATLSLSLGVAGVSAFATGSGAIKDAAPAEASTSIGGVTFYIDTAKASNTRWSIYYYGSGDGWISMNRYQSSDTYYATIPAGGYTSLIFCRMNTGTSGNTWSDVWNQTADLSYDGAKNKYETTGYNGSQISGKWTTQSNVNNGTVYFVDGYSWHNNRTVYAHFFGGSADTSWPGVAMNQSAMKLYCHVDSGSDHYLINVYKYTFTGTAINVVFNNGTATPGNQQTGDLTIADGGIYYYGVGEEYGLVIQMLLDTINASGSYTDPVTKKTYTSSICAISSGTASSIIDNYNLYLTYNEWQSGSYLIDIKNAALKSTISTYSPSNPSPSVKVDVEFSNIAEQLGEKYNLAVSSKPGVEFLTSIGQNGGLWITVVGIIVISVAGGYFFLRKKKEN